MGDGSSGGGGGASGTGASGSAGTGVGSPTPIPPPPPLPTTSQRLHKQRKAKPTPSAEGASGRICAAYCLASGHRLHDLRSLLLTLPAFAHVDVAEHAADVLHCRATAGGHAFFFESGASVFWDVAPETRRDALRHARKCDTQPGYVSAVPFDEFDHEFEFTVDESVSFRNDRIQLRSLDDSLDLLSLSFGLAQSVKLLVFELAIDRLVEDTRRLPEELAAYGRFQTVSQDAIKRRIGQLLSAKYSVALLSDILDTPDLFWEHSKSEALYLQSVHMVDLQKRARLLDKRMDIVKDSLALLNSELTSSTSHRVERAIVALIAIEVGLEVSSRFLS